MNMSPEDYMKLAMDEAEIATCEGNAPFGVVVVSADGTILWKDHDRVIEYMDPTAHGEVNAIRSLCKKLNTLKLEGTIFYTTSEPCPTCLTSMIKARVFKNVYGTKTESSASLPIPAEELAARSLKSPIQVFGGVLAKECLAQRQRLLGK